MKISHVRRLPVLVWEEGEKDSPQKRRMPEPERRKTRVSTRPAIPRVPKIQTHTSLIAFPFRLCLKKNAEKTLRVGVVHVQSQAGPQAAPAPVTSRSGASQMVLGVRALDASMTSSRWLHMATNRSKKSFPLPSPYTSLPHFSISACIVPLRLNVLRQRMMRAR